MTESKELILKTIKNKKRKDIEYEDDLVIVYDSKGKIIYKGEQDYEPMKDESWKHNTYHNYYFLDNYFKICLDI